MIKKCFLAPLSSMNLVGYYYFLFSIIYFIGNSAYADDKSICRILSGAKIIAQNGENTFLGSVTNKFDDQSIFNNYGDYGNKFGDSIWNQYSEFGNKFNEYSPFNVTSQTPTMFIKNGKIIGYLSSNKSIDNSVSPNMLRALCADSAL